MRHPASHISDHLLVLVSLAFIGGIACSPEIVPAEISPVVFRMSLVFLLSLLAVLHLQKKSLAVFCLVLPMAFVAGCYHGYRHLHVPADETHIYHRIAAKTDVVLIGTMATMADFDGRTSQVEINAGSIQTNASTSLLPVKGKILLRLQGPWPDTFAPGDTLAIRIDLKRPDSFRTPGVFDYAQYLARRDIWITGFVRSPLLVRKIEEHHSFLHTLRYLPERIRARIGRQIDTAVPAGISGVYRAILIGDRSHVDESALEIFKGSGTMHILAISGLHMAVIGTLLYLGLFWLLSRSEQLLLRFTLKKWAAFCSLPVLLSYGLLAGMNTPVFRAVIMSSVVIVAICMNRQKSPGALLAFAAMLILTVDPLQLFTASFQLSFLALIGILFFLPVLKSLLYTSPEQSTSRSIKLKIVNWLFAGLLVSLVANLATAPIAIHSFNRLSTVGPLANLIIEPLICLWSLPAGFLSIIFILPRPEISTLLLQAGSLGINAAMHVAAFISSFTFSTVWLPTPPVWLILCYFFILAIFIHSGWKTKWRSFLCVLALSLSILPFIYRPGQYRPGNQHPFQITFMDVGQGSAALIEYPSGFRVLVDGGGSSFAATTVGERVIAPFLWNKGIRNVDAIVITHPDADHYNGLGFIIDHFSPKTFWISDENGHDDTFQQLIHQAKGKRMSVSVPNEGQRLLEGLETFTCVANMAAQRDSIDGADSRSLANGGLILKACFGRFCILFPGDIGRKDEGWLVTNGYDVKADVLLAAHHGSITSNSPEFLAAVSPRYLMVSAGRTSKGRFPHKHLAEESNKQRISLKSTADEGTLEMIVKGEGYRMIGYRKRDADPLSSLVPVLLAEKSTTLR